MSLRRWARISTGRFRFDRARSGGVRFRPADGAIVFVDPRRPTPRGLTAQVPELTSAAWTELARVQQAEYQRARRAHRDGRHET